MTEGTQDTLVALGMAAIGTTVLVVVAVGLTWFPILTVCAVAFVGLFVLVRFG